MRINSFTSTKSTGQDYISHSSDFNVEIETNPVPRVPGLSEREHGAACALAKFENCDFFLWEKLKEKVFKHRPHTLEEFQVRIMEQFWVYPFICADEWLKNFRDRLQECIAADGRQLSDIILKTWCKKLDCIYCIARYKP